MTKTNKLLIASLVPFLSNVSLVACGNNSTGPDTGSGDLTSTDGTSGTSSAATSSTGGTGNVTGAAGTSGTSAVGTTGGSNSPSSETSTASGSSGGTGNVTGGAGTTDSNGTASSAGTSSADSSTAQSGSTGASSGADSSGTDETPVDGVHVQMDKTFQTIQGFGINSALMPSDKSLPMNDLFGLDGPNAIGLSILRVGMDSTGKLTGQGITEAKAKGAKIIGSTWSPPKECKTNGNTQKGGHLISDDGGACYESWATTIANFAQQQDLYAMSIANESDFASCKGNPVCTDDYDTTVYTGKEMAAWVKVAGKKLKDAGIKVIAPEASEWIHAWSNASGTGSLIESHPQSSDPLNCGCFSNTPTEEGCAQTCLDGNGYDYGHWLWKDQDAWSSFDIFGVHEYDSQIAYAWPADVNGGVRDKEVWQTEMSGVMHWPEQGPSIDINNGVAVAGWIHSALTIGEASAWLYWWYEAYYQNDNEGLALIQGSSTIAKRYYALGNYSKFIRPGYIAVAVAGNDNDDVLLSAYKGEGSAVVIVAINKGDTAVEVPITITGATITSSLTPHVTSASDNLKAGTAVPVTGGVFTASLGPKTVTSFVGE